MERLITMSAKEIDRAAILGQVKARKLTKTEAARQMGISRQQVDRLHRKFCKEGALGLVSKRRGAPSNNRIAEAVREQMLSLIREHYPDFNPSFAHEKLVEVHGFKVSDETVRQMMIKAGLWQGKRRKAARVHQMRARRPCFGELIQIDGSPHDWFEGRRAPCCLLVLIDDATSCLVGLRFVESECLEGYFDLMKDYLIREGRPVAIYSDRHTIFHVPDKELAGSTGETQFGRAMRELDIDLIPAHSPQAKGRVERANGTLQNRLIKEMRLLNISDIQTANAYLPKFIDQHNRRFAKSPAHSHNAHRLVTCSHKQLNFILSVQQTRKLSHNLELSYKNILYQVQSKTPGYAMRGTRVIVSESHGQVALLYKGNCLPYTTFDKRNQPKAPVSGKEINDIINKRIHKKLTKPKANHPWRNPIISKPFPSPHCHISTLANV